MGETFEELIKKFIDRRGINDSELARRIFVHRITIRRWKTGETHRPDYENIIRVADVLGLTPSERNALLRAAGYTAEGLIISGIPHVWPTECIPPSPSHWAEAAIQQAKGHIQRANALISEGMQMLDPEIRNDPEYNPYMRIRMKLLFQTRQWDPDLFDPHKAIAQATASPSRYTLGLLWRTAYVLWHTEHLKDALRCFHVHRELSKEFEPGQELGNGMYIYGHTRLQIGQPDIALENFLETSCEFARDRDNPESFYFTDLTKFSHLLASLSIAFHQKKWPNKALYCLALSGLILRRENVVVKYGGGLQAFCCTAQRVYPFAYEYLTADPLKRKIIISEISNFAFLHEEAQELLDSSPRDLMIASFYENLVHASDDRYAHQAKMYCPPSARKVVHQSTEEITAPGVPQQTSSQNPIPPASPQNST